MNVLHDSRIEVMTKKCCNLVGRLPSGWVVTGGLVVVGVGSVLADLMK